MLRWYRCFDLMNFSFVLMICFAVIAGIWLTIDLPDGETYSWQGVPSTSMRRGDFKLIEFHEDNTIALYNLKDDPGETKNLAKTMPKLAEKLYAELKKWQKDTKAPISTVPNPEYDLTAKVPEPKKASRPKRKRQR